VKENIEIAKAYISSVFWEIEANRVNSQRCGDSTSAAGWVRLKSHLNAALKELDQCSNSSAESSDTNGSSSGATTSSDGPKSDAMREALEALIARSETQEAYAAMQRVGKTNDKVLSRMAETENALQIARTALAAAKEGK